MCWTKRFVNYSKSVPGHVIHVIFDNYENSEEFSISNGDPTKEKNIMLPA